MRIDYIELLGTKHPVCFSLSAAREIGEHYGGMDKLDASIKDGDVSKLAEAVDVITEALLKAGRIYDKMRGVELPPKLECRASDIIDVTDADMIAQIFSVLQTDSKREVEAETSKNAETTQGN